MLSGFSKNELVSLVDQRVLSIPIQEAHEPLIDLREQSIISFGPSPEIPNNQDYTKVRNSIYQKLIEAQKALPSGLKFCLYEGYRSLKLQQKLFDDRYQLLKKENPDWTHEQLFQETIKLVSPVVNLDGTHNIPPHSTGAAIDIYLVDSNKKIVDMGIKVENCKHDIDGSISKADSSNISNIAKQNRDIMSLALKR